MEQSDKFREFYTNILVPYLKELEIKRKKTALWLRIAALAGVTGFGSSIIYFGEFYTLSLENLGRLNFLIALLLLVFWSMAGVLFYKKVFGKSLDDIRYKFKRSIIARIVEFVDPGLGYFENKLISQEEYEASKLFPVKAHYYYGEDYLLGKEGNVSYKFSELHTQFIMKDHRRRKLFITIFQGLFFIADVNATFETETVILPDTAHKLFGPLGDYVQQWNVFRKKVIKVDDLEFDKEFVVYGTDEMKSKKALTDKFIKRVGEFKKKTGHNVYISLIGSRVNVAIPLAHDLFEPPVFGSMLNYEFIFENYRYLKLATGIVDDLGLN